MKQSESHHALAGTRHKEKIETPSLLIDLDAMETNIRKMASFFQEKPAKLRPHAKTHKTPILAHKQMAAGSIVGITVAKLGEAEVMARAGIQDLLIANQVVEPAKITRLAGLSRHVDIKVAVDDLENVRMLDQAAGSFQTKVGVLIEVNIGLNRCGVEPGEPVLPLVREVLGCPNLVFCGLMGYEGHAVLEPDLDKRTELATEAIEKLIASKEILVKRGIEVDIVSAGGTGTYKITGTTPGVDEIQAGSYIFMDSRYQQTGVGFDQALTLLTTVVSRPQADMAVLDAGMKAISLEFGLPSVKGHPEWELQALHEEHAILRLSNENQNIQVGAKIELIPSHGCTTINLHDRYYALRKDYVEAIWPIEARGKFR